MKRQKVDDFKKFIIKNYCLANFTNFWTKLNFKIIKLTAGLKK